ncbi:MAG: orotate phosphoribosyltransferase [Actinobacteria bacterium]|jgi:orotate phosphoribosyltransferase|nr:orotate phosphoribosyltransferase [Actinomycetota bacterium]MCL6095690.1 orotate phosphoribosyltransferase [Actinomycetota bacterium]
MADTFPDLVNHLRTHSVKLGNFTLKSGRKSSWFIDAKQTLCRPDGMMLAVEAALSIIPAQASAIGGLTMGADPIAFAVAAISTYKGKPLKAFSVRKIAKDHGAGGRIAGALDEGDKVVVVEDAATRGTSLMEAVTAVEEVGAEVVLLLTVVDRGGVAGRLAEQFGLPFAALVTAPELGFPYDEL